MNGRIPGASARGIVIVGGGPAGLEVARSYRECGGEEPVAIVSEDAHPPYSRPPLTKEFLRGEMDAEDLPLEGSDWYERNGVEVRPGSRVVSLDRKAGSVALSGGNEIPYSRCVLATGARPLLPPVPGVDSPRVCVIRTLDDAQRLVSKARRVAVSGGRFVVIGSGFIGCEAAASLSALGLEVLVLTMEEAPQLARLGPDAAREISSWLSALGVEVHTAQKVGEISAGADGFRIFTDSQEFSGDGLLIGAGMRPSTELAEEAGLLMEGGVVCESSMRTSDDRIYAVGDVALATNEAAGRRLRVEHWGDALGQGRVCGEVMAGRGTFWDAVPGFWSSIGEKTLKYAAWGDGWDEARCVRDDSGDGFTVWYGFEGRCVGVLTHERDEDYERGRRLIANGAELPV